jgi:hypothetical protein
MIGVVLDFKIFHSKLFSDAMKKKPVKDGSD